MSPKEKRLYKNGAIYTADPANPWAEAVAVSGDTILAVGPARDCRQALDGPHETVDLGRRMMVPGFFDVHCHLLGTLFVTMNTDLFGVRSIGELVDRFLATDRPGPGGDWLIGLNFEEQALDPPVMPTRTDLDAVSTHRPVVVLKRDGHSLVANTRALALAGVTARTPDPAGGTIEREAGGRPSGIFREKAGALILDQIPLPDEATLVDSADATAKKWLGYGITSLGVMLQTGEDGPAGRIGAFDIPVMQMLGARFPQSIYALVITRDTAAIAGLEETVFRDLNVRIGGLKIITDGTFGSCTAAMNRPFTDHPDRSGFFLLSPETIYRLMEEAHLAGYQVAVHAIGDRAMRTVVDLFDRLLAAHPRRDHRHRIEHAAIIDAAMIEDIRRLGLILSVQPMFIHSEKGWLEKRLGPERARITYPFADVARAKIPMAGSSDAPVESQSVLHAIQCCVTREGLFPEQAVSLEAAIRMYTMDAARSQFAETRRGSIAPGKQADLVVLEENLFDVAPEDLARVPVVETIIAGKSQYRA